MRYVHFQPILARKPGRKWLFVEEHLMEWLKGDYAATGEMAHKRGELCPSGQHLNPGLQAGAEKRSSHLEITINGKLIPEITGVGNATMQPATARVTWCHR